MGIANFLAELLGVFFIVTPFSLFINPQQLKNLFLAFEKEFVTYANGLFLFILGVVMILLHNVWIISWEVLITIVGWLFILKGLFLMFFTRDAVNLTKKFKDSGILPYLLLIVLFLGLVLLYFGFVGK